MTAASPRFSIVVPAYNIEPFIHESLTAIRQQTFEDFECVVVNDGSTDATARVIAEAIGDDRRFTIVTQKNGGLSNARNSGFKKVSGEYVMFLDGDDVFEESMLDVINHRLLTTDADVVIYNSDGLNNKTGRRTGAPNIVTLNSVVTGEGTFTAADIKETIFNTFYNSVWTKAFRRKLLTDNKLVFDDTLKRIEDLPFTNAAFVLARSITFIDRILLHYRYNTEGSNTSNNYKYHLDIIRSATNLYDFLKTRDMLETYRQSFDNAVINDCEYYLWWVGPYPEGRETFDAIKRMLHRFGIDVRDRSYFYKPGYDDVRETIATGTYDDYLRYLLRNDRKTHLFSVDENDRQNMDREAEIGKLQAVVEEQTRALIHANVRENDARSAYERIVASKSYRIGNVVAKPVRIVKDLSKRRK